MLKGMAAFLLGVLVGFTAFALLVLALELDVRFSGDMIMIKYRGGNTLIIH